MANIIALVLGGGRGTRLYPLTKYRSKPAVPLAGKYRLIDIPLSNCIHSGINRIYVLTQFNSVSLHRHIRQTYIFDGFSGGFVEVLAAQQTMEKSDWYQGTADAVRQNLRIIQQLRPDYVLILSGDQLYRMHYDRLLDLHQRSGADVTIAALPVHRHQAASLGIMRLDDDGNVVGFLEKPQTDEDVSLVLTEPAWIDARGVESRGRECLANMGIYLFNRQTLLDALEKTDYRDFGKEVFPAAIRSRRVQAYLYDGYWEDIGTIRAFYDANLALRVPDPPFALISPESPLYTRARFLPPSRIDGATIHRSLIADGCQIEPGAVIEDSVVGVRCRIGRDAVIRRSVIMGNDFYQMPESIREDQSAGRPLVGIGRQAVIEGAIIDKNCRIGQGVQLVGTGQADGPSSLDDVGIYDGVLVAARDAVVPDGWKLGAR